MQQLLSQLEAEFMQPSTLSSLLRAALWPLFSSRVGIPRENLTWCISKMPHLLEELLWESLLT